MIRTAKVIEVRDQGDRVGLFDKVTIFNEMAKQEMTLQIVTTLRQDALKGLKSAAGFLRRELGRALQLRYTPELQFIADDSIQHGAHILEILRQVERQDGDAPDGGASGETEA